MFSVDFEIEGCRVLAGEISIFDEEGTYEAALAGSSPFRQAKALYFRFEEDRKMCVLASILLDKLLADRGLSERDMTYAVDEDGKPSFEGHPEIHFSVAHGGGGVAVAMADRPVGVDIERLDGFPRDLEDPYRWTEMESVGKLLGCGVGGYVDEGSFEPPADVKTLHVEKDGYLVCLALATEREEELKS